MDTNLKNENMIRKPVLPAPSHGFTLVELLVVISIISVLVAFSIAALGGVKRAKYISTARGEMTQIQSALERYKAKYGVYPPANQNTFSYAPVAASLYNQLYYELSGTVQSGGNFVTLDGSASIPSTTILPAYVQAAYNVGGFINCTKGGGEETQAAQNFLPGLKANLYYYPITNNQVPTTELITSVGGPDDNYQPLNAQGLNPFRYVYPGTNNPNSYDLWVQLSISGKKYLVCNWNKNAQVNAPYP